MSEVELCPDRKGELLAHYATKEPYLFEQLDGINDCEAHPDSDGDTITGGQNWELRSGRVPVRVEILSGTSKDVAVRLLRKIVTWLDASGFATTKPPKADD